MIRRVMTLFPPSVYLYKPKRQCLLKQMFLVKCSCNPRLIRNCIVEMCKKYLYDTRVGSMYEYLKKTDAKYSYVKRINRYPVLI